MPHVILFLSSAMSVALPVLPTQITGVFELPTKTIRSMKSLPATRTTIQKLSHSELSPSCPENYYIALIHAAKTASRLKQTHAQIICHGLSENSRIITQLISTCSLFKSVDYAVAIFRHTCHPNQFIFNSLIRALSDNAGFAGAIACFTHMLRLEIRPDRLTLPYVLKSVASLLEYSTGGTLHASVIRLGLEMDSFVRTSLADMYVKFGFLDVALQLFEETPERNKTENVLLWNVLISGCCKGGDMQRAMKLFEAMPERTIASWNSLINGFFQKRDVDRAVMLFGRMLEKNVVSWTTMLTGFSLNGDHQRALHTFYQMVDEGVKPNEYAVISALSACTRIGALDAGIRIHKYVLDNGFQINTVLGNALVDMYAKCGEIDSASRIFRQIKRKDILTWSIMISGWATHGCCREALQCFEDMKSAGIPADEVVFLSVLTACSHAGLVDQGLELFDNMCFDCMLKPTLKHYACMLDLFVRAGRLEEAFQFINSMPIEPDFVIWGTLFCGCRAHKNIEMAELASKKLLEIQPKHPGSYVFLSNIYARAGRWEDVERVRNAMRSRGIDKPPGWSFIEIGGDMHTFTAGDQAHANAKDIYQKLGEIVAGAKTQGYMPNIDWVLHNIEEEEKEDALGCHSEKLALAFGLLSTASPTVIRIVKNLRICGDCHSLMKYTSKIAGREIVLRDIKRFHHFRDGFCTCGDYW